MDWANWPWGAPGFWAAALTAVVVLLTVVVFTAVNWEEIIARVRRHGRG